MRVVLTETQMRGLIELAAACDESIGLGGEGWVRTNRICGTKEERSASNMRGLVRLSLAEGVKYGPNPQGQWSFRATSEGRRAMIEQP